MIGDSLFLSWSIYQCWGVRHMQSSETRCWFLYEEWSEEVGWKGSRRRKEKKRRKERRIVADMNCLIPYSFLFHLLSITQYLSVSISIYQYLLIICFCSRSIVHAMKVGKLTVTTSACISNQNHQKPIRQTNTTHGVMLAFSPHRPFLLCRVVEQPPAQLNRRSFPVG